MIEFKNERELFASVKLPPEVIKRIAAEYEHLGADAVRNALAISEDTYRRIREDPRFKCLMEWDD